MKFSFVVFYLSLWPPWCIISRPVFSVKRTLSLKIQLHLGNNLIRLNARTMKKTLPTVVLLCVALSFSSCGWLNSTFGGSPPEPESFEDFYYLFHSDPAFQLSRIDFPIEGAFVEANNKEEWTEENWAILRVPVFEIEGTEYQVEYRQTETEFYQKIWLDNTGFVSEYRFELIDGLWYLVYAYEQNL